MTADATTFVLDAVRKSLKRSGAPVVPPAPPVIPDSIARLMPAGGDLRAIFMDRAGALKMLVQRVNESDIVSQISAFLRERNSKSVMFSDTPLINRLDLVGRLGAEGFSTKSWRDMSLDDTYAFDAGVTEVDYAVAETGTVAIRHSPQHGRLLSLVPFVHVAIIESNQFLPDMLDLFESLKRDGSGSGVTLISGPSKTADIEMNVVTGVHGPNVVKAFIL